MIMNNSVFVALIKDYRSEKGYDLIHHAFNKSKNIPNKSAALKEIQRVFPPPRYEIMHIEERPLEEIKEADNE